MAEKKPEKKTYYRTDPLTGETSERIVVTPADEVRARFDGFTADKQSRKAKSSSSSSTAKSDDGPDADATGDVAGDSQ